jgi:uncharacterized protein YqfA (UPF0365 family)
MAKFSEVAIAPAAVETLLELAVVLDFEAAISVEDALRDVLRAVVEVVVGERVSMRIVETPVIVGSSVATIESVALEVTVAGS